MKFLIAKSSDSTYNINTRMKNPISSHVRHARGGFALVVTLSLMVLLSILALGMLSLSAVEMRRSSADSPLLKAQTNAKLGLMMALRQLQLEIGPDQRISVPGGQMLPTGTMSPSANWTAVYDSWPAGPLVEKRPAPSFRRWLISGDESIVSAENSAADLVDPAADTVALTAASTTSEAIVAGLVPTPDGTYAWWVADQNTKAKLSGEKPNISTGATGNRPSAGHATLQP